MRRRLRSRVQTTPVTHRVPGLADNPFLLGQTKSPAMQELERAASKVAPTNIPILITGESGTGKEILADHIHRLSPKGSQPMAKAVCAVLNRESLSAHFNGQSNRDAPTGTCSLRR